MSRYSDVVELIKNLEVEKGKLERDERKLQEMKWKEITGTFENYEYRCIVMEYNDYHFGKIEGIRVEMRIKQDILMKWKENGFSLIFSDLQQLEKWFGEMIIRVKINDKDILASMGGGYKILNTPCPCSDEIWDNLKKNIVSENIKNNGWIKY